MPYWKQKKTQVFRYEVVHEMIQKLTNQDITIQPLLTDQTPISFLDIKLVNLILNNMDNLQE
jgi:hypothetical protein